MTRGGRRGACGRAQGRERLEQARAFLELARLGAGQPIAPAGRRLEQAAAATAILAAIAASDAICCCLLGTRARGQDHREAVALLERTRPGAGDERAKQQRAHNLGWALSEALDVKNEAQYGFDVIGVAQVKKAMRAAEVLVAAADDVVQER